jgi:hypothetical protein
MTDHPALLRALLVAFALAGCDPRESPADGASPGPDGGAGADGGPGYRFAADNPIDRAMEPLFAAAALTPRAASDGELCRRVSADTRGFLPTVDEVRDHCAGHTPAEIVAHFLAAPETVGEQQRQWVQTLELDPGKVFAREMLEVDPLVAQLAGGELAYDRFVVAVAGLPAIATNVLPRVDMRQDPPRFDEAADRMFRVFRGRAAGLAERTELAKLYAFWQRPQVADPELSMNGGLPRYSPELAPEACTTALGEVGCTATLAGRTYRIQLPPGHVAWESFGGSIPPAVRAALDQPGLFLIDGDELWDAAASRVLRRLLGWFQSTRNLYESDLPTVRRDLAAWFRDRPGHSWRDLLAVVMTSVLYAQTADWGQALDRPSWAAGPTKFLTAEGIITSIGRQVLKREVGFCDPHTSEPIGTNYFFPDRFRRPQPQDFYGFGGDFFQSYGSLLGGCQGGAAVPVLPSLPRVFAEPSVITLLVSDEKTRLGPEGWTAELSDGAMSTLADWVARRAYGRSLVPEERRALAEAAAGCRADPECAADPMVAARSLATSMLMAAEATTY